jgi:hypothetical protein
MESKRGGRTISIGYRRPKITSSKKLDAHLSITSLTDGWMTKKYGSMMRPQFSYGTCKVEGYGCE